MNIPNPTSVVTDEERSLKMAIQILIEDALRKKFLGFREKVKDVETIYGYDVQLILMHEVLNQFDDSVLIRGGVEIETFDGEKLFYLCDMPEVVRIMEKFASEFGIYVDQSPQSQDRIFGSRLVLRKNGIEYPDLPYGLNRRGRAVTWIRQRVGIIREIAIQFTTELSRGIL